MREEEFEEEDQPVIYAFHFMEEISNFAEQEMERELAAVIEIGEALFVWRSDEMQCLLNQLLSVGTFAVIENHGRDLALDAGIVLSSRAVWGEIRTKLERILNRTFDTFPSFTTVETVRRLANCFKHNGGWPDTEMIEKSPRPDLTNNPDPDYVRITFWRWIDTRRNLQEASQFLSSLAKEIRSRI